MKWHNWFVVAVFTAASACFGHCIGSVRDTGPRFESGHKCIEVGRVACSSDSWVYSDPARQDLLECKKDERFTSPVWRNTGDSCYPARCFNGKCEAAE